MAFKRIERTTLQLSMIMLSSLYVANVRTVNPDYFDCASRSLRGLRIEC